MELSDPAKKSLESGTCVGGSFFQNKDKKITITKISFFCIVYYSKNRVTPTLLYIIAAIFDVILYILQHWKSNINMPIKFSKYSQKRSKIVTN